jgi:hypothetical protein
LKPLLLFVGLSLIILGSFVSVYSYPKFTELDDEKQRLEYLGGDSNPFLQNLYRETVQRYNETLIALIGGIVLLIVGLGITIYGATTHEVSAPRERFTVSHIG